MRRADGLAATRALRHLVNAHRLVGPALAVAQARGAEAATALGRVRPALPSVAIADEPPAAAAGLETRRAGGVVALRADPRVGRTVLHPAGLADARVLLAGGLLIHATPGDAVIGAEVLGAHGAPRRARVTGAVPLLVPAHDELRRGPAAMRARHRPRSRSSERPLGRELAASATRRSQLPLDALHQHVSLDELERVHDRLDLVAAHLLGPAPLVQGGDRTFFFRVGLVREDGSEVPVKPIELRGDLFFRDSLPRGNPFGALLPQVAEQQLQHLVGLARQHGGGGVIPSESRPARVRIASIKCGRNGVPTPARSASGLRSKASRERANRTDSRPWKWTRSAGGSFSSRRSEPFSSSLTPARSQ